MVIIQLIFNLLLLIIDQDIVKISFISNTCGRNEKENTY